MVGGQDADRLAFAGKRDDGAAVRLLEHRARQRLFGAPERHHPPVEAEHLVPGEHLVEIVRGEQHAATFGSELDENRLEKLGTRPVDAGERLVEQEHGRVLY